MCIYHVCIYLPGRELSCYILLPRSRFIGLFGSFLSSEKNCPAFYLLPGRKLYRKLAGTTTLAYRFVINCTAVESVHNLVSMFRLACSSHRQETDASVSFDAVTTCWENRQKNLRVFSPRCWNHPPLSEVRAGTDSISGHSICKRTPTLGSPRTNPCRNNFSDKNILGWKVFMVIRPNC